MLTRHPQAWRIVGAIAVSAAFVVLLVRQVEVAELRDVLAGLDARWLVAAAPVYAVALWLRSERWLRILRPVAPLGSWDALSIVVIGYGANNVVPARAGEVLRAVLVQRRAGGSRLTVLATIVVERVFDGLVLTGMLALALPFAGRGSAPLLALALLATVAFVAAALAIAGLALRPHESAARIVALTRLAPARLRPPLRAHLGSFLAGLGLLRGPAAWGAVLGLTLGSWLLEAVAYWLVASGLGVDASAWTVLAMTGAANIAISAPSAAGGVGPFEYFAREVMVAFGAGLAAATATAIVVHAFVLVPVTLVAALLAWREGLGARALATAREPEGAPLAAGGVERGAVDEGVRP